MSGIPRLARLRMWDMTNLLDAFRGERTDDEQRSLIGRARVTICADERKRARRVRKRTVQRMIERAARC